MPNSPDQLATIWLAAIARPDIRAALESIYSDAAAAIAQRGPACWASGRCCHFEAHGHRLYVTGLEAAYTIAHLSSTPQPLHSSPPPSTLSLPILDQARVRGGCPFQSANLCTVHTIKPLGCRLYFCDRAAQQWQNELSEQLLARVRSIHDQFSIPYRYGDWRTMLEQFASS